MRLHHLQPEELLGKSTSCIPTCVAAYLSRLHSAQVFFRDSPPLLIVCSILIILWSRPQIHAFLLTDCLWIFFFLSFRSYRDLSGDSWQHFLSRMLGNIRNLFVSVSISFVAPDVSIVHFCCSFSDILPWILKKTDHQISYVYAEMTHRRNLARKSQ